jgi:hypothetical protein
MLVPRRSDRSATTRTDRAFPAIAIALPDCDTLAGRNTVTMAVAVTDAVAAGISHSVPGSCPASAATTSTASTMPECRSCRQGDHY